MRNDSWTEYLSDETWQKQDMNLNSNNNCVITNVKLNLYMYSYIIYISFFECNFTAEFLKANRK